MTGWRFPTAEDKDAEGENVVPDPLHDDFKHLRQIYFESDEDYSGRFTVPVLYDKKQKRIVSNESSEILRMFGTAVSFGEHGACIACDSPLPLSRPTTQLVKSNPSPDYILPFSLSLTTSSTSSTAVWCYTQTPCGLR